MGCNLAAFFTGIPQFSLHAWFFAIATAIGTWFGAALRYCPCFDSGQDTKSSAASPLTKSRRRRGVVFAQECWCSSP
jgi:hypothetical protein